MITLSTPCIYSLELTSICNSRCPVCSNVFERKPASLPASDWRKIIALIAPHAEVLKLTGGEPTLHPEFEQIIHAIAERDIPFTLFSNARWRKPQAIIDLLKTVPQCRGLLISLHGHNAETHEGFTRTPHSFEEACENIRLATDAGLRVHTSTVITRYNWNRVDEAVALSQKLGAKRAVFNRYLGPVMPEIEPDEWQLQQAVRDIEILMRSAVSGRRPALPKVSNGSAFNVRYGTCIPQCFTPSSSTGCWAGVAYCTIDPWGNLRPCNHSPTIVGNLFEESLESLWQSEAMNDWRALLPGQCNTCTELETCRGGCRALVEIREKDPLIRLPIHRKHTQPPIELEMYEHSQPVLNCRIQPEHFGYALIRGHTIVPVTTHAKVILDKLNGDTTLQQLQADFGQEALDFVGTLYYQGLLSRKSIF